MSIEGLLHELVLNLADTLSKPVPQTIALILIALIIAVMVASVYLHVHLVEAALEVVDAIKYLIPRLIREARSSHPPSLVDFLTVAVLGAGTIALISLGRSDRSEYLAAMLITGFVGLASTHWLGQDKATPRRRGRRRTPRPKGKRARRGRGH
jgi:hypothetical protein